MPPHLPPAPAAGDDARLAELRASIGTLRARIAGRDAALAAATARRDAAHTAHEKARADYRATPAGLSASLRDLERALLTRRPAREVRALQHAHVRAELAAAREYRARASRWGHKPGDGPLMACPIGADGAFATWMLSLDVTGTYRHTGSRDETTVVARLSRTIPGRRTERARITVPAALIGREGLTLRSVLAHAASQLDQQPRLQRLLGDSTDPVLSSIATDPPAV